ncbi:hypothetical protein NLG97_g8493 [Lecanicillium saksenae]|uniref:Uncharacterized protein n=1 Tax=Lecanicillium saksenae TaxID=468837 RepID=A0ACC1QIV9_9HYPO|nr:hypothetical protein NLG97_g8493 [Lecanicillium saksenae]
MATEATNGTRDAQCTKPAGSCANKQENSTCRVPLPIAIPQVSPKKSSSFLPVYTPELLHYGVTEQAWRLFLQKMSRILADKPPRRSILHAQDMAFSAVRFGTGLWRLHVELLEMAKELFGDQFEQSPGLAMFNLASAIVAGPFLIAFMDALAAPIWLCAVVFTLPVTRRERAKLYAAATNHKWMHSRGLHAQIMSSEELEAFTGASVIQPDYHHEGEFLNQSKSVQSIPEHVERLFLYESSALLIGRETLWLVILRGRLFREAVMAEKRLIESMRQVGPTGVHSDQDFETGPCMWDRRRNDREAAQRSAQLYQEEQELIRLHG